MRQRKLKLDILLIFYYAALIIMGLGATMLIPTFVALAFREWNIALDFVIAILLSFLTGNIFLLFVPPEIRRLKLSWLHGMVAVTVAWFIGMIISAIPYYLSGFYGSFLDAAFDVMSGLTTTGLTLIQDLDHVPYGINMWRHLLSFIGGQGMVVLALGFLFRDISGAFKLYVGEAKDEHILPNTRNTARVIWAISLIYLFVGTVVFWLIGMGIGLSPLRAFFHGLWVFMAAWSTGGFAPQSQNIMYYHSVLYELVCFFFMTVGSFNFALHYHVFRGNFREAWRNMEIITFLTTFSLLFLVVACGLAKLGGYTGFSGVFRKGFFHLLSAHTGTGFMTIYSSQFHGWSELAISGLLVAMLLGGSACSTAGGFKALRVGIIWHTLLREVKRLISPESAIIAEKFHHIRDILLEERHVRGAMLTVLLYIVTFTIATIIGTACGFSLYDAAFEAASATGNVGLSIGVATPGMPAILKIVYIFVMWVGRLEFMAVLAGVAFVFEVVRRR